MTTTLCSSTEPSAPVPARVRARLVTVVGLVVFLVLGGTGIATALWTVSATTTAPVVAGRLSTELAGTAGLSTEDISTDKYTTPVELALRNTSPVPVDYALGLAPVTGTLDPAQIELTLWTRAEGAGCPAPVPDAGTTTGTLAAPPALPEPAGTGEAGSTTVVCAATRFTGTLFGSAGKSLTATPHLDGRLAGTSWSTRGTGGAFTQTMAPAPGPVTNLHCTDQDALQLLGAGIQLTWTEVSDATGYRIRSSTGWTTDVTDPRVDLAISNAGEATYIEITALGPTGAATPVPAPVHVGSGGLVGDLLGVDTLRCGAA